MTRDEFAVLLLSIQEQERAVRAAGQAEYAHRDDNCFDNFDRAALQLNLSRERVLAVFALKHWDGIIAHINGHTSQREDVRGRIKDLRLYLALLWGMLDEADGVTPSASVDLSSDDVAAAASRYADDHPRLARLAGRLAIPEKDR
jgi:hypothetical protein